MLKSTDYLQYLLDEADVVDLEKYKKEKVAKFKERKKRGHKPKVEKVSKLLKVGKQVGSALKRVKRHPITPFAGLAIGVAGLRAAADRMEKKNKKSRKRIKEAEGWHGLPKGWKQSSLQKFSTSLTGKKATQKGFFDKCVKRMEGKIDNPEAFCASIKDERHGSTFWRGKGKTPQQAGKDVKRIRNVQQEGIRKLRGLLKYAENPELKKHMKMGFEIDKDKAQKRVRKEDVIREILREEEDFLAHLNMDHRADAKEWQGANIPYGDDSNRPNLIRKCTMMEDTTQKINCLRKLRDQAAMNPFYQHRIDRYIDEITDTYEPTNKPGTIPGNEFKTSGVGEDTRVEAVQEGVREKIRKHRNCLSLKNSIDSMEDAISDYKRHGVKYPTDSQSQKMLEDYRGMKAKYKKHCK